MSTETLDPEKRAKVIEFSTQLSKSLATPEPRPVPAPGIYAGVPFEMYHRWDAANHSLLKLFSRSAAHAREEMAHPSEPTEAREVGHTVHTAILEPDVFDKTCIEGIKVDRRTKDGKKAWADFEERFKAFTVLSPDEMALCRELQKAVWTRGDTSEFLKARGQNEVSIAWIDPKTGVLCKARIDMMRQYLDWPFIGDLKTTRDASKRSFSRDVHRFGYHQQAAMYVDGCLALGESELRFAFLAVEKERPYAAALYEIDETSLDQGRQEYLEHLVQYEECKRTGVWPGYPEGMDYIGLPSWAFKGWGE